jgi:hypothetical protein
VRKALRCGQLGDGMGTGFAVMGCAHGYTLSNAHATADEGDFLLSWLVLNRLLKPRTRESSPCRTRSTRATSRFW